MSPSIPSAEIFRHRFHRGCHKSKPDLSIGGKFRFFCNQIQDKNQFISIPEQFKFRNTFCSHPVFVIFSENGKPLFITSEPDVRNIITHADPYDFGRIPDFSGSAGNRSCIIDPGSIAASMHQIDQ